MIIYSKEEYSQLVTDKVHELGTGMIILMFKQSWMNCQNQENEIEQLMHDPELKGIALTFHRMNTDQLSSDVDTLLLMGEEYPLTLPLTVLVDNRDNPFVVRAWDKFVLANSLIAESYSSTVAEIKEFLLREKD